MIARNVMHCEVEFNFQQSLLIRIHYHLRDWCDAQESCELKQEQYHADEACDEG